jgi:molybdate transport system ATP-binding protein
MTISFSENLLKLAAVVYRPEDDVDGLLADFAAGLLREGHHVGGVVQRNAKGACGPHELMQLVDLMTGEAISICQALGEGAASCKLDPAGLAQAAVAVSRAIAEDVELVVVNKFSKQEAAGAGLRSEVADAIVAGLPVVTAVPERLLGAWEEFTGGFGTTLLCDADVVADWWREVSRSDGRRRALARLLRAGA